MQQMEHVAGMQVEVDPVDVVKLQKEFAKAVGVKRNKQVDVPTEAWQKNVERRLEEIEYAVKEVASHRQLTKAAKRMLAEGKLFKE